MKLRLSHSFLVALSSRVRAFFPWARASLRLSDSFAASPLLNQNITKLRREEVFRMWWALCAPILPPPFYPTHLNPTTHSSRFQQQTFFVLSAELQTPTCLSPIFPSTECHFFLLPPWQPGAMTAPFLSTFVTFRFSPLIYSLHFHHG